MPIYEYQCKACGHCFEIIQKINELPLTVCPECQRASLQKCVSKPSFQLKGTGWYETDFKKKPEEKTDKQKDKTQMEEKDKSTKEESSAKGKGIESKPEKNEDKKEKIVNVKKEDK